MRERARHRVMDVSSVHVLCCTPWWNIEGIIVYEVGYWNEAAPRLELYWPTKGVNNSHTKDGSFDPRLYCWSFHASRAALCSV